MGKVESLRAMREAKYSARLQAHANHPAVAASAARRTQARIAPCPVDLAVPRMSAPEPTAVRLQPRPDVEAGRTIARYRDDEIDRIVAWLLSDGVPRGDDTLVTEFMAELGFERRGKAIRARVGESLARLRGEPQGARSGV